MTNQISNGRCPHWTAGWCYHPETPECTPCVGWETCSLFEDMTDAPFSDGPDCTDYPGEDNE